MALDILPSTQLGSGTQPNGIHFHSNGASASQFNNPTDFAAPSKSGTAVSVKINGTDRQTVRFQNPS